MHRSRNLDELALGDRQVGDQRARAKGGTEPLEHFATGLRHGLAVDHTMAADLHAEMDVLGHSEVRGECQLLVDDRDAVRLGSERPVDGHGLAVNADLAAGVGLIGAGQHLHQRGLAGAVLAHQGVYLARIDGELHVGERPDPGKGLGDAAHLEDGLRRRHARCLP